MPLKWILSIFKRKAPSASKPVDGQLKKQQNKSESIQKNSITNNQLNYSELQNYFFSWLLNCHTEDLITTKDAKKNKLLKNKEQAILNALNKSHLDSEQLPRRPSSLPMLLKLLNDKSASPQEISKILLSDPSLVTQILKTVNSPFFRISENQIDSVDHAVVILGNRGIKNIVATTLIMPMMAGKSDQEVVFSKRIWHWGLLSASACDQYSKLQSQDTGPLYLLGLIPSIAYLFIYRSLLTYQKENPELGEIEPTIIKSIIQKRSWTFCQEISQQWGLPSSSIKHLKEAKQFFSKTQSTPLRDSIFIGTHQILKSFDLSPLEENQLFPLTKAPSNITKKVIQHIESNPVY